ncbi:MAG: RDD family protein [Planctomycetota bacterium]
MAYAGAMRRRGPTPPSTRRTRPWPGAGGLMLLVACLAVTVHAPPAIAGAWRADLPVASDGRHLWSWAAAPAEDQRPAGVAVFHADLAETPADGPAWESVTRLTGRLAPGGAVADDRSLWLFFADGTVQRLGIRPGPIDGQWLMNRHPAGSLPRSATLRAAAAAHGKLWVLIRVESADDLARLDPTDADVSDTRTSAERARVRRLILGLPSDPPVPPDEPENTQTDEAPEPPPPAAPDDRLLVLERGAWRVIPLPDDWRAAGTPRLVAPDEPGGRPTLAVAGPEARGERTLTVYHGGEDGWSTHEFPLHPRGDWALRRVDRQPVLLQQRPGGAGFTAEAWAIRGDERVALGTVSLPAELAGDEGSWSAIDAGGAVGVLAGPRDVAERVRTALSGTPGGGPPGPALAAIDLRGEPALGPIVLDALPDRPLARAADAMILLGVVISSTVLLFTFWRRDPTANELVLPDGLALADLPRRGIAGLIDLAPGLLVATTAYGLSLEELYSRWPGRGVGATWSMMLPGVAAVAAVVAHTTLLELATGRSLGKWVTGLRVVTLDGRRPGVVACLARGLLKSFDLVAYLLLILPVISPYRQRLGDMVARTVVVAKAKPTEDDDGNADGDET